MNDTILGILLLVAIAAVTLPAALYGVRFSVLWSRKRRGEQLDERERKLLKKNAALALVLFVAVYAMAFKCIALFK